MMKQTLQKRVLSTSLFLALGLGATSAAELKLAVVAPKSGPFAILGDQVRQGASLAAGKLSITLVEIDETCSEGSGKAIAEAVAAAGAKAAIGFLCSESLKDALPGLKEDGLPAFTLSVRWKGLMEDAIKGGSPLFRLAPNADQEAAKLSDVILRDWAGSAVALLEDGTIRGRELTETIRLSLEERGLKPAFVDTFRPGQEQQLALVRRIRNAGVTHAFIGGDRSDVAVIARDAKAEGLPLTLLGGEAMRAADEPVPLEDGVLAVGLIETPRGPAEGELAAELDKTDIEPEGYVVPAHAAVTILADAWGISTAMGTPVADTLIGTTFETALGPVAFGEDHELTENPYRLLEWRGDSFVPVPDKTQ
ncbi:ABC transporter substrate-binding protein [Peteryoungia algae]|uniref:ABC transporter substrate-binding protein n=1 Tax=Peteryoungia algae TaxID=2919917 RepID=A0ABT0D0T0_9HYPH|nr:ABC transporter substrate-binding protein [Rhizobium sp. SSM4.3]MCJ8238981.1 ABC transporter substrate-binding protein [Rhizobium sp. SSM4.3]